MQPVAEPIRVADPAGATALAAEALAVMTELEGVLARETEHVRAGRLREGLADDARKAELSARYMRSVAALKANAVALARFAPNEVLGLKAAHARFAATVETNQTVLATARTVSEGLIRGLSDALRRETTPQTYGNRRAAAYGTHGAPKSAPLVLSRSL
jgi:hypothetical protein